MKSSNTPVKTTPATSRSKKQAPPLPPKVKIGNRIFGGFMIFLLLGILYVVGNIAYAYYGYKQDLKKQTAQYVAAEQRCGKQPVVVVDSTALEDYTYKMYTPLNPDYNTEKVTVEGLFDFLGSDTVAGYYCSIAEAKVAYATDDTRFMDNTANYSAADLEKLKAADISQAVTAGTKFYAPSSLPNSLTVSKRTLSAGTIDIDYTVVSAAAPDPNSDYSATLICTLADTTDGNTVYGQTVVGTNVTGGPIYYSKDGSGTWISNLPGSVCTLNDYSGDVSAQDGATLISSVHEIDPSALSDYSFQVY